METGNELGLIGTIEDSDNEEANAIEEDSDDEVILLLLHVCTWKHWTGRECLKTAHHHTSPHINRTSPHINGNSDIEV